MPYLCSLSQIVTQFSLTFGFLTLSVLHCIPSGECPLSVSWGSDFKAIHELQYVGKTETKNILKDCFPSLELSVLSS